MALAHRHDVVILGGGLAGLTAALQIRQRRPETTILVADRRAHPVPEAAFKVGESTGELGAYYVTDIVGAREHVQLDQLTKLGLRMFFSADGNRNIGCRMEVGPFEHLPVPAYQFDRGRLENFLGAECLRQGVRFLDDCRVRDVELGSEMHRVTLLRGKKELAVEARWLVDGSGRTGILRRKLGLHEEVGHKASAAWFRIQDEIDLEDWSTEPSFRQRMLPGLRRFSTNHLMGPGYWVWLIPLASKTTSVGIVIDEEMHSFQEIHRFEGCLDWLAKHEPQCFAAVQERRHLLMDFLTVKHFAYSSSKVFSPDRWCLTGVAGVFTDALYSPGTDFIAVANTLTTDLITRELDGEDIGERLAFYDDFFLGFWFDLALRLFERQYPILGNAQVMTAKIIWDFCIYWGVPSLLYFHDKLCDLDFMRAIMPELRRCQRLQGAMQGLMRAWTFADSQVYEPRQIDYVGVVFMGDMQRGLVAGLDDARLAEKVTINLDLAECLAVELWQRAAPLLGSRPEDEWLVELDRKTAGTAPRAKVQRDLEDIWLRSVDHVLA